MNHYLTTQGYSRTIKAGEMLLTLDGEIQEDDFITIYMRYCHEVSVFPTVYEELKHLMRSLPVFDAQGKRVIAYTESHLGYTIDEIEL
jgi:hypothetical protein